MTSIVKQHAREHKNVTKYVFIYMLVLIYMLSSNNIKRALSSWFFVWLVLTYKVSVIRSLRFITALPQFQQIYPQLYLKWDWCHVVFLLGIFWFVVKCKVWSSSCISNLFYQTINVLKWQLYIVIFLYIIFLDTI